MEDKTLKVLYKGILTYTIIAMCVLMFFLFFKFINIYTLLQYASGLIIGATMDLLWAKDIYKSIDIGLEKSPEEIAKYMKLHSIIRMAIIIGVIILISCVSLKMTIGIMIGLFGLKFAAYYSIILNKKEKRK